MRALVTGAGGFLGHYLVQALSDRGWWVRGVDLKRPEFTESAADEFIQCDLRRYGDADEVCQGVDEVFAFAADMGGMGYISTHDADILSSNIAISLNTVEAAWRQGAARLVYASSACVYPEYAQLTTAPRKLAEDMAYPADPQDGYGWEKLTTEKLLAAYCHEGRLDVRIARFHNIYGPEGTWRGGREKAPAALCRKIAEARDGDQIQVWGDGAQTRSFCYVDDAIESTLSLSASSFTRPLNIGSEELVTIDELARIIAGIAGKDVGIAHVEGPQGVRGRNSDNTLIRSVLGREPSTTLREGLVPTYRWIEEQVEKTR